MIKKLLSLLSICTFPAIAITNIKHVEVVESLVVVTVKTSRDNVACGGAPTDQWGLDLTQEQDHALYGLILTAVAKAQAIEFMGSGICLDNGRIERISKASYKG
ncbi:hypothetical protein PSECIP111854_04115 [Pseudoalteromonas sp. CIP111854]|uniref:Uncharacterized protein n=1 Tax=Pseudoalteromonas holothuriae TaxID=2963714 RepID=A0A9W4W0D2_9GAMM|nr:hypothetical protein [Pseudoalteromonas sp. CIP111854]CAH9067474.1 hypothetical protein PSECIP111854_04115 [Pseudoalteromonas sp. CIP111854]